jgi:hypothetical protein
MIIVEISIIPWSKSYYWWNSDFVLAEIFENERDPLKSAIRFVSINKNSWFEFEQQ